MRKTPYRPSNEITQAYNDGVVRIYTLTDAAGRDICRSRQATLKTTRGYEEQRLGLQRYYQSKQNLIDVERVVRTPRTGTVSSQDMAITEDGKRYRVELVQTVEGVYPPSVDITLAKIEQRFEDVALEGGAE